MKRSTQVKALHLAIALIRVMTHWACMHAAQELITFDVNENGSNLPAENQFGARTSFFNLRFGYGFGTVENDGGTWSRPDNTYSIVPESPPNVAVWSPNGPATIQPAPNVVSFALNSIYVGYLQASGAPAAAPVVITGYLQTIAVAACSYTVAPTAGQPPTLVTTPGCGNVDQIEITDNNGEYFFIDNMDVTLFKLSYA